MNAKAKMHKWANAASRATRRAGAFTDAHQPRRSVLLPFSRRWSTKRHRALLMFVRAGGDPAWVGCELSPFGAAWTKWRQMFAAPEAK